MTVYDLEIPTDKNQPEMFIVGQYGRHKTSHTIKSVQDK